MEDNAPILTSLEDGVLVVTFNRPERLNSTTPDMMRQYMQTLLDAGENPEVRVVVLTGAGRAFCAGADSTVLGSLAEGGGLAEKLRRHWFLTRIPKPVIAAINGPCVGLGLVIAMMCDMRVAARGAKLISPFCRLGLPAENGLDWILPRVVGQARAFEVMALGDAITGDDLLRLGLVNRLVDDDQLMAEAMGLARRFATACSPTSLALIKTQLQRSAHVTMREADMLGHQLIGRCVQGPDFQEAIASRREKRQPLFTPLPAGNAWWPRNLPMDPIERSADSFLPEQP